MAALERATREPNGVKGSKSKHCGSVKGVGCSASVRA